MKASLLVMVGLALGVLLPGTARAMPDNARQVPEGYWVGDVPLAADVADMHARGIRVFLSAVVLDEDARAETRRHGIARVNVWFGNNFPDSAEILDGLAEYEPSQIYVHCDHGGDRAGALLAFLLVAREGWRPDHALLAVAFPNERDVEGLILLLQEAGLFISEEERATYTGIYSGAQNGGTGGLKVRGEDYRNLVRTTLAACESVGVTLAEAAPVVPGPFFPPMVPSPPALP